MLCYEGFIAGPSNDSNQPATLDLDHSHATTDDDNYLSYLLNSLTLSFLDHLLLDLNPISTTTTKMINKDGNPGTGRASYQKDFAELDWGIDQMLVL